MLHSEIDDTINIHKKLTLNYDIKNSIHFHTWYLDNTIHIHKELTMNYDIKNNIHLVQYGHKLLTITQTSSIGTCFLKDFPILPLVRQFFKS